RDDAEFLHGVERHVLADGGGELVVVRRAVEQHVRGRAAEPVERNAGTAAGRRSIDESCAATCTVSCRSPSGSRTFTVAVAPTATVVCVTRVRKPESSALIS